ncbi:MAG: SipW-dependent-type signal peptide-containing protein [Mycobacteriaceae bacterium]
MNAPAHSTHKAQSSAQSLMRSASRIITSQRARAVLTLGLVFGLGTVGTLAIWSDTATATSGIFSTGTVDITIDNNEGKPTAYGFTALGMTGMLPGNSKAAMLAVRNKGTLPFTYTTTSSVSGALATNLKVKIYAGGAATNTATTGTCSVTTTNLYDGTLAGVSTAARTLAATTGLDNLCFLVTLDTSTPISQQSATATATFIFNATAS